MGDAADDVYESIERAMWMDVEDISDFRVPEQYRWFNADGEELDMRKMDTRYLRNAAMFAERRGMHRKAEAMKQILRGRATPPQPAKG